MNSLGSLWNNRNCSDRRPNRHFAVRRFHRHDQTEVARSLVKLGADVITPSSATSLPHRNFSREPRLAVNHSTGGFTPLMIAARQGNREAAGFLLECYGASRTVYPSGMSLSMGGGRRAYRLALGRPGRRGR